MYDAPGSVGSLPLTHLCFQKLQKHDRLSEVQAGVDRTDVQSIRYVLISETVVKGSEAVHYFSRGQRVQFVNMLREENDRLAARFTSGGGGGGRSGTSDDGQSGVTGEEEEEGGVGLRAYG